MRNLEKVIEEYLSKPTDYAIQIVGSWGHGKTYYYKNVLQDKICKHEVNGNARKKYKPIYISLFGLKSIEDIATKIVIEFYQSKLFKKYFNREKFKITQNILKIGLRGFINFNRLGNANEYLTDIKEIGQNVLDAKELVICFDDLERKDSTLNLKDLIGYINSLVDEGIKILIISNEDLLLKLGEDYKDLKEKIIGITIPYIPDVNKTLESIIKSRYESSLTFIKFLNKRTTLLINFCEAVKNNFRHVIYSLDCLHNCYSLIRKNIIDVKHELSEKIEEQLDIISVFTLAFSAEYKSSNLQHSDLLEFQNAHFKELVFSNLQESKDSKTEPIVSKYKSFIEKYKISTEAYRFFESIFYYVTGYNEFLIEDFIKEFTKEFNLNRGKVLPQYELLNLLSYNNYFNLIDEEYKIKTYEMIQFAEAGLYKPSDYFAASYQAERMDNILNLDIDKLQKQFKTGLTKSIWNTELTTDHDFTHFRFAGSGDGLSSNQKELHAYGVEEINKFCEQKEKERVEHIGNLLLTNVEEFENKFNQDKDFRFSIEQFPFLKDISTDSLFDIIIRAKNKEVFFLNRFFHNRYKNHEMFKQEEHNYNSLRDQLCKYKEEVIEKEDKSIKSYLLKDLIGTFLEIEKKYNEVIV